MDVVGDEFGGFVDGDRDDGVEEVDEFGGLVSVSKVEI